MVPPSTRHLAYRPLLGRTKEIVPLRNNMSGWLRYRLKRYGSCILPMDEALVLCAIDLSGRPYYVSDAVFTAEKCGDMDLEMVKEFFYAVSYSAGMNLHFKVLSGSNNHHIAEAMFKAFAKALDAATLYDERIVGVLSTKETL